MGAIVIQSHSEENLKLLKDLAIKLGEKVSSIDPDQLEDIALGMLMKKEKTGKTVNRETIMRKLRAV